MELLQCYISDDSSSSDESCASPSLSENNIRSVYLITYSQADLVKFPSRRDFANAMVHSFSNGAANVVQWCCSLENHSFFES